MARGIGKGISGAAARGGAADRPTVGIHDLARLVGDVVSGPLGWDWVAKEGIAEEAMLGLFAVAVENVRRRIDAGEELAAVIQHTIGQSFHFGFETHRQYGRDR